MIYDERNTFIEVQSWGVVVVYSVSFLDISFLLFRIPIFLSLTHIEFAAL